MKEGFTVAKDIFTKYGNFNSADEINEAAKNQLAQGDTEAIREIARENGLDPEDAEDFITGGWDRMCSDTSAALGKISIEEGALTINGIMHDWIRYIQLCISEDGNFAKAVRSNKKSLAGALGAILKESEKLMEEVDDAILEAADINFGGKVKFGIPEEATVREIVRNYYMEG
jgi:hypothetical protein